MKRRSILRAVGTGLVGTFVARGTRQAYRPLDCPGCGAGTSDPPTRTVDMVSDAGCDPTGAEPCGEQLQSAAADDTRLFFPEGEYLFSDRVVLEDLQNFRIVGEPGTTFVAPADYNGHWIVIENGRNVTVENLDVDVTADESSPSLVFGVSDGLLVRNVEVVGRGIRSDPSGTGSALLPYVTDPDGTATVERFVATEGGRVGKYKRGNSRMGIYVGESNYGTVRIVDCHLEEFPNNGIYASRTRGQVHVEGGTFRNNDVSQVRIGSEGSYVDGATIEVDVDAIDSSVRTDELVRPRGIRYETGGLDTSGVTVRNTDIRIANSTAAPGIVVEGTAGECRVEDTTIRVDDDSAQAVLAKPPNGSDLGPFDPPPRPHWITLSNVEVTGNANRRAAIEIYGRAGSAIRNSTVRQPSNGRDGIYLKRAPETRVTNCEFDVGRYPAVAWPPSTIDRCLLRLSDPRAFRGDSDGLGLLPLASSDGDGNCCLSPEDVNTDGVASPVVVLSEYNGGGWLLGTVQSRDDVDLPDFDGVSPPIPVLGVAEPRDLDDDGLYENVSGDGEFSLGDVQIFFSNLDLVRRRPGLFDFNGDGEVTIGDVLALWNRLRTRE